MTSGLATINLFLLCASSAILTAVDINRFLLSEAALLRDRAGLGRVITFTEADARALPFANDSFDGTVSITLLEEVDADRALAEMVRVTRPGGRVGVAVRALDVEPIIGADLPESIVTKARTSFRLAGAATNGCAAASLYRRLADAGLTDLCPLPQFNSSAHLLRREDGRSGVDGLDTEDQDVWIRAVAAAGEAFFVAQPMHVAVGTKPLA